MMSLRDLLERIPDATAISIATKQTAGWSFAGIISAIAGWNWPAIIASAVALLGLLANLWFQRRRDAREQELHRAKLNAIREGREP